MIIACFGGDRTKGKKLVTTSAKSFCSRISHGGCKWQLLSGNTIKIIAIISMFIDHLCKVVLTVVINQTGEYFFEPGFNHEAYKLLVNIVGNVLLPFGRVAFPLFCFLLIEGYVHTSNRKKYFLRMVIFATVSELPFDLAFLSNYSRTMGTYPFSSISQNVFFTHAIGIVAMWIIDKYSALRNDRASEAVLNKLFAVLCVGVVAIVAYCLKTDYDFFGVLLIATLYFCRKNRLLQVAAFIVVSVALGYICLPYLISAAIMVMYNTSRGKLKFKYSFYVFYPAHLIILYIVSLIIQ